MWYEVPYVLIFIAYFENIMLNTIEPKLLVLNLMNQKYPGLYKKDELSKHYFKLLSTLKTTHTTHFYNSFSLYHTMGNGKYEGKESIFHS